jgi:hypothetical protein
MKTEITVPAGTGNLPFHRSWSLIAQWGRLSGRISVLPLPPVSPLRRLLSNQAHLSPAPADQSLLHRLPTLRPLRTRNPFTLVSFATQQRSFGGNVTAIFLSAAPVLQCSPLRSRFSSSLRRFAPNRRFEGTAEKLRFSVPSALRAPAAPQAKRWGP